MSVLPNRSERGFTLTELAVVFVIISLLLATAMYTLSAQTDQRNFEETRRRLEAARELLLAFAIVNGRLPCPATATSSGDEAPVGGGACTIFPNHNGFLPARSVGFQITDAGGYAIDAWGNRIRYAVSATVPVNSQTPRVCRPVNDTTPPVAPHFTHRGNLKFQGLDCQPNDLVVCRQSPAVVTASVCDAGTSVTNQNLVVALVLSTGKNGATGGTGVNEARNLDSNALFVSRTPDPASAAGGEFDDQMTWITVGELYGKLIAAGALP
jgi:prepilin-type N-terminal cleavage/methylation domain-containing protein